LDSDVLVHLDALGNCEIVAQTLIIKGRTKFNVGEAVTLRFKEHIIYGVVTKESNGRSLSLEVLNKSQFYENVYGNASHNLLEEFKRIAWVIVGISAVGYTLYGAFFY
jgi:hypothetical protein